MGRSKKRRAAQVAARQDGQSNIPTVEEKDLTTAEEQSQKVSSQQETTEKPETVAKEYKEQTEATPEESKTAEESGAAAEESETAEAYKEETATTEEFTATEEEKPQDEEGAPGVEEKTEDESKPVPATTAKRKLSLPTSISIQRVIAAMCLVAALGFVAGTVYRSGVTAIDGDGTTAQVEKLSGEDYNTVLDAVDKRFADGTQFYYTGNVNGQYTMSCYAMDDGSTLITTQVVPADYDSESGEEPVQFDEIPTDYLSKDCKYYIASVKQEDSSYTTTWVNAGEEVSKYATYLRDLDIPSLVKQATSIRYAARINLDSDLVGVEIYEMGVSGEALTEVLSKVQKAQYTYLYTRAVESGDSEFADQNESVLKSMQMNNQMSDGTIEIGVKDGNLYYFGISTGGGGYSYVSQYTFKDLLPYTPEVPDVSKAVDIYEDAKAQYDTQMEAYEQYQQSQLEESEGN